MGIIRKFCINFYWKAQYLIVPGLRNTQYVYKEKLFYLIDQNSEWLDLGCGHEIIPGWISSSFEEQNILVNRSKIVVGIDYNFQNLKEHKVIKYKINGDIKNLPFKNESLNIITANMVIEHVKDPALMLSEIYRILKKEGLFVFHTPNLLSYRVLMTYLIPKSLKRKLVEFLEVRKEEDVFPTYYKMNKEKKIKYLVHQCGFKIIEFQLFNSSAETIMFGPIVLIELLLIRILNFEVFKNLRSTIIAVFKKNDLKDKQGNKILNQKT